MRKIDKAILKLQRCGVKTVRVKAKGKNKGAKNATRKRRSSGRG